LPAYGTCGRKNRLHRFTEKARVICDNLCDLWPLRYPQENIENS